MVQLTLNSAAMTKPSVCPNSERTRWWWSVSVPHHADTSWGPGVPVLVDAALLGAPVFQAGMTMLARTVRMLHLAV